MSKIGCQVSMHFSGQSPLLQENWGALIFCTAIWSYTQVVKKKENTSTIMDTSRHPALNHRGGDLNHIHEI